MAQRLLVGGDQAVRRQLTAATIYALSSGALPAGIAVVRVSGPRALAALEALAGELPRPRVATLRTLVSNDGQVVDNAIVIAFPGPGSATGEDVAEFHVHGGKAVVAALLGALAAIPGLLPAAAGEFTRRAFDNGRLDLAQAEGLADLVAAETEAQRRAALAQAGGVLGKRVAAWREAIIALMADAEAGLDFAEAEDDVAPDPAADARLQALAAELRAEIVDARRARSLRDGLTIVVSGPPNAGKSSLVNALARREVAIVSPFPGTTRDAIEARLDLGGVLVTLVDTAGLRESDDPVEAEGIARARARAAQADLVLALYADGAPPVSGLPLRTKLDLAPHLPGDGLAVSSLTGEGIAALTEHLAAWAAATVRRDEPPVLAAERHRTACLAAVTGLDEAAATADPVLRAEALRAAAAALGSIVGLVGVDDILDAVFTRFCIGK